MNRLFVFLAVVALVIALPVTHEAFAGNNNTKVEICHVNSSNSPGVYDLTYTYYYSGGYTYTYPVGRVIEVNASAVAAHVAHGDSTYFYPLDEYTINWLESLEGLNGSYYYYELNNTNAVIKNADCYWTTFQYK